MTDSSEDEDLSKFREAVDSSFTKLIDESRGRPAKIVEEQKPKSERYLEVSSHYNDVRVPDELQNRIGAKVSAIINKNIEFVDVGVGKSKHKKLKIRGGVKLFKESESFLSSEEPKDTYTALHNCMSKHIKKKKRKFIDEADKVSENDKLNSAVVTPEYIISKEETKCWKSRRKEKIFKYKSNAKSNVLTAVE